MKIMFGKTQIKYFYQGYFNHDINSKQIIICQLKTKQRQTSTQKLLISPTSFKFHVNQINQTDPNITLAPIFNVHKTITTLKK
jgi:hypothetical protein